MYVCWGENYINSMARGRNLIAWEAGNSELTLILPFCTFQLQSDLSLQHCKGQCSTVLCEGRKCAGGPQETLLHLLRKTAVLSLAGGHLPLLALELRPVATWQGARGCQPMLGTAGLRDHTGSQQLNTFSTSETQFPQAMWMQCPPTSGRHLSNPGSQHTISQGDPPNWPFPLLS